LDLPPREHKVSDLEDTTIARSVIPYVPKSAYRRWNLGVYAALVGEQTLRTSNQSARFYSQPIDIAKPTKMVMAGW